MKNAVGLSEQHARENLRKFGKNSIGQKSSFQEIINFFRIFFSPLILLLLGASIISALLGDVKDFLIIFTIILVSGTVSYVQHFRAEQASNKLRQKVQLQATVVR